MRAIVLLSVVVVAHGQFLDVPDWHHYLDTTENGVENHGDVTVQRWNRIGTGFVQETMNPPALHKLTIPSGEQFPAKGSGDKTGSDSKKNAYWLMTPATYVVTKGTAAFHYENGTKVKLSVGELFYSPAGVKHGPIKPAGADETVVLALAEWPPRYTDVPAFIPGNKIPQHVFQPREDQFAVPPLPGFPDCIRIAGNDQGAISVRMKPDCRLPYHYHPTGVFYFFSKGALIVGGDIPDKNVTFPAGNSRWARPAWAYGPEVSIPGDEETWFIALGQPPTTGAAPDTEDFVIRNNVSVAAGSSALQPAYTNDQAQAEKDGELIPKADPKEQKEWETTLSQKRVRRHLRSNVELDESVLLQTPLLDHDHDMEL